MKKLIFKLNQSADSFMQLKFSTLVSALFILLVLYWVPVSIAQEDASSDHAQYVHIELPAQNAIVPSSFNVSGWTINSAVGNGNGPGVSSVEVYIGDRCEGTPIDSGVPNIQRIDVVNAFDLDVSYINPGYRLYINPGVTGETQITVCSRDTSGEVVAQSIRMITIDPDLPNEPDYSVRYYADWIIFLSLGFIITIIGLSAGVYFSKNRVSRLFLTFFIISECVFIIYWLAFYPAIMSDDSFMQLGQLNGALVFSNWHPYIHTLWLWLLTLGTMDPAVASLLQLSFSSLIFAGASAFFINNKVPAWLVILLHALFIFMPSTGYYNITLLKDVAGYQFITLVVVGWLWILQNDIRFNRRGILLLLLFAWVTFMAGTVRHNHSILLIVVPVLIWLVKQLPLHLKGVYTAFLILFCVAAQVPLWLGLVSTENTADSVSMEEAQVWLLGFNWMNNSRTLSQEDREFLGTIIGDNVQRAGWCYLFYFNVGPRTPEAEEELSRIFWDEVLYNPMLLLTQRTCNFFSLLGLGAVQGDVLYWPHNLATAQARTKISTNTEHIVPDPKLPSIQHRIMSYMNWTKEIPQRYLFWGHLLSFMMVLVVAIAALYWRDLGLGGVFFLYAALLAMLYVTSLSRGWRYLLYLSPFLFYSVPIIILRARQWRTRWPISTE